MRMNLQVFIMGAIGGLLSVLIPLILSKTLTPDTIFNIYTLVNMIIASVLSYSFMHLFFKPETTDINHLASLALILGLFWQPAYKGLSASVDKAVENHINNGIDSLNEDLKKLKVNENLTKEDIFNYIKEFDKVREDIKKAKLNDTIKRYEDNIKSSASVIEYASKKNILTQNDFKTINNPLIQYAIDISYDKTAREIIESNFKDQSISIQTMKKRESYINHLKEIYPKKFAKITIKSPIIKSSKQQEKTHIVGSNTGISVGDLEFKLQLTPTIPKKPQ